MVVFTMSISIRQGRLEEVQFDRRDVADERDVVDKLTVAAH
jgi:hypothetical protein